MSDPTEDADAEREVTVTRSSVKVGNTSERREGLIEGRRRRSPPSEWPKWDRAMLFEQIEKIEAYAQEFAADHGFASTLDWVDGEHAGSAKPLSTLAYAYKLEWHVGLLRQEIDDFERRVQDESARREFYVCMNRALSLIDDFQVLQLGNYEKRLVAYGGHHDHKNLPGDKEKRRAALARWHELNKADPTRRVSAIDEQVSGEFGVHRATVGRWRRD